MMKKTDTAIKLLTLAEAASILKISKRTLHRMIQHRQIPAFKVGGQWRILESRCRCIVRSFYGDTTVIPVIARSICPWHRPRNDR